MRFAPQDMLSGTAKRDTMLCRSGTTYETIRFRRWRKTTDCQAYCQSKHLLQFKWDCVEKDFECFLLECFRMLVRDPDLRSSAEVLLTVSSGTWAWELEKIALRGCTVYVAAQIENFRFFATLWGVSFSQQRRLTPLTSDSMGLTLGRCWETKF